MQYVLTIAEAGSFTAAARLLHVAQPSVSQQVIVLERELGVKLFQREPGRLALTDAGRAFAAEARVCLAAAHRAQDAARQTTYKSTQELDVAAVTSLAMFVVPRAIAAYRSVHPTCKVRVREVHHPTIVERLVLQGEVHVGVGPVPQNWPGAQQSLGWDELRLVLSDADPLAASEHPIALASVIDRDWVLCDANHGLRHLIDHVFSHFGLHPRVIAESGQIDTVIQLAGAGLGATIAPGHALGPHPQVASLGMDPPLAWEYAAIALPKHTHLLDGFAAAFSGAGLFEGVPAVRAQVEPRTMPIPLAGLHGEDLSTVPRSS